MDQQYLLIHSTSTPSNKNTPRMIYPSAHFLFIEHATILKNDIYNSENNIWEENLFYRCVFSFLSLEKGEKIIPPTHTHIHTYSLEEEEKNLYLLDKFSLSLSFFFYFVLWRSTWFLIGITCVFVEKKKKRKRGF